MERGRQEMVCKQGVVGSSPIVSTPPDQVCFAWRCLPNRLCISDVSVVRRWRCEMGWKATGQPTVRLIPIDPDTVRVFASRRAAQAAERLAAGTEWDDNDLIVTTRTGGLVLPRTYDRALANIVDKIGLPRLTSHGLRHTAATHMVQGATDVGELRAIADLLGHSPEMLMNSYAHTLPRSQSAVVDRIGRRGS